MNISVRQRVKKQEGKGLPLSYFESMSTFEVALRQLTLFVQKMVEESGEPDGFDPLAWTISWLNEPCPALGGRKPNEYMGSVEGRALVAALLGRLQSGAYS